MQSCTLRIGTYALKGRFLRCQVDGVWLSQDQLVGELARSSRKGHAGGGGGMSSAARAFTAVAPSGSAGAAVSGIGKAFTQNQRTPIGSSRSHVQSTFVSAFRGRALTCPSCLAPLALRGDQWACAECAGTFVENAALVAMVQDVTRAFWELPVTSGESGTRACPACASKMSVEHYGSVTIDRCAADGVWLDESKLATLLLESSQPKSTGGWLRRLFGRR